MQRERQGGQCTQWEMENQETGGQYLTQANHTHTLRSDRRQPEIIGQCREKGAY